MPAPFLPSCLSRGCSLTLFENQLDLDLKAWIMANSPWDGNRPAAFRVTVAPDVVVGSSATSSPALIWQGAPADTRLTLVVSEGAVIAGCGADGGSTKGLNNPLAGKPGGVALRTDQTLLIENNGIIGGGGGSGATGKDYKSNTYSGGGGAGAGNVPGRGIVNLTEDATLFFGAAGAVGNGSRGYTSGGRGGDLGQDGGGADGKPGGTAGAAVVGMANVIWIKDGDLRGPTS